MNNYVLRETNFFYDDSYSLDVKYTHWRIYSKYDNLEIAKATHEKLEIKAMRKVEPYLFCELFECDNNETLSDYFEKELNIEIDDSERNGFLIPQSVTDIQILQIKNILNVDFYKMVEFQGDIIFYKPVMNESFWGQEFMSLRKPNIFEMEYKGYAFYDSKEDARLNIPKILNYWISTYSEKVVLDGLHGKLEELSQKPNELLIFLENSTKFKYNQSENKIEVKRHRNDEIDILDLTNLINLLDSKPYDLLPISFEEAKRLGYIGKTHIGDGPYGDGCYYGDDYETQ